MLEVKNITKYYGDFKAVDNLSFTVNKGEIFGLLGVNGAGKTTTFRMIMGLLEPSSGSIKLDNKPIDYTVTDKIGFLTEERSLLTKLTVKEQCEYYGALKNMCKEEVDKKLDKLLKRFEIEEYKDKKIKELSKGNQQKIQFITAILNDPKLLILDEPFSGLDPFNVELFKEVIIEMANKGSIIIFSSHRMEHVELFCEKIVILMHGQSVLEGYIKDIKEEYRQKNIFIRGDIELESIRKIDGVKQIISHPNEFEIKVDSFKVADKIFDVLKKSKSISKFIIEEPTLNEIFVSKVGESYEK